VFLSFGLILHKKSFVQKRRIARESALITLSFLRREGKGEVSVKLGKLDF